MVIDCLGYSRAPERARIEQALTEIAWGLPSWRIEPWVGFWGTVWIARRWATNTRHRIPRRRLATARSGVEDES